MVLAIRAQILLPVHLPWVPRLHWGMPQKGQIDNVARQPTVSQSQHDPPAVFLQNPMASFTLGPLQIDHKL